MLGWRSKPLEVNSRDLQNHQQKSPCAINTEASPASTNSSNLPTPDAQCKEYETLAAGFALSGHTLRRSDPKDGAVSYWAERWGLVRYLPTIDATRRFLDQIGGRM